MPAGEDPDAPAQATAARLDAQGTSEEAASMALEGTGLSLGQLDAFLDVLPPPGTAASVEVTVAVPRPPPPAGFDAAVWFSLPDDLRAELEAEHQIHAQPAAQGADLDFASFLATLTDPELRRNAMITAPSELVAQLPDFLRTEAEMHRVRHTRERVHVPDHVEQPVRKSVPVVLGDPVLRDSADAELLVKLLVAKKKTADILRLACLHEKTRDFTMDALCSQIPEGVAVLARVLREQQPSRRRACERGLLTWLLRHLGDIKDDWHIQTILEAARPIAELPEAKVDNAEVVAVLGKLLGDPFLSEYTREACAHVCAAVSQNPVDGPVLLQELLRVAAELAEQVRVGLVSMQAVEDEPTSSAEMALYRVVKQIMKQDGAAQLSSLNLEGVWQGLSHALDLVKQQMALLAPPPPPPAAAAAAAAAAPAAGLGAAGDRTISDAEQNSEHVDVDMHDGDGRRADGGDEADNAHGEDEDEEHDQGFEEEEGEHGEEEEEEEDDNDDDEEEDEEEEEGDEDEEEEEEFEGMPRQFMGHFFDDEDDDDGGAEEDLQGQALDAAPGASRFVPLLELLLATCSDVAYVERFCQDHADVINALVRQQPSLLEDALAPLAVHGRRVLTFEIKRAYFRSALRKLQARAVGGLRLSVNRDRIFEDSLAQLSGRTPDELRGRLSVTFRGEEGIDAGGVSREWFQVLLRNVFKPDYALFKRSADSTAFQPDPRSSINSNHLSLFKFVGRVVAKALVDGVFVDAHFTRSFLSHILGRDVTLGDLQSLDPVFHKSLTQLLAMDDVAAMDLVFTMDVEEFGVSRVLDIVPGGSSIPVTMENRHEYVLALARHKMSTGIREQLDAFLAGFYDLVPKDLIKIFSVSELELLICGLPKIDVDDWEKHSNYLGYEKDSAQIMWFWRFLRSLGKEDLARLLMFVTGTSLVPLEGFAGLQGMRGAQQFSIHRAGSDNNLLPCAHTCFNQLDLPAYSTEEILRDKLTMAIHEGGEGFGFV